MFEKAVTTPKYCWSNKATKVLYRVLSFSSPEAQLLPSPSPHFSFATGTVLRLVTLQGWPSSPAPELLAPSSPCLRLCKFPQFSPAVPLSVFLKDAPAEVCRYPVSHGCCGCLQGAACGQFWAWVNILKTLMSGACCQCRSLASVVCWPQAEMQLNTVFLRSNAYGRHHLLWCMNSHWTTALYIHLSVCGRYQIKLWSSPRRDLHTVESILGQQKLPIVQHSAYSRSLFFSWGSYLGEA